jgi:hypothetical protein
MRYECPKCHAILEADDLHEVLAVSAPAEPGAAALRGRLRIVGANAGWFQPDLDRTSPSKYTETQKKTTYAELCRMNQEYGDRGGNKFPVNVLQATAELYNTVQQAGVMRSKKRRVILSALLYHTCINQGFMRMRRETAEFMKLHGHGIAQGDDHLRGVAEDYDLKLDMNRSQQSPCITTTLSQLDLDGETFAPLRAAIDDIVGVAVKRHVGIQSILRSKVIATTYEVLLRARGLMTTDAWAPARAVTLSDVTNKCHIRTHTITRFRTELALYHDDIFQEVYLRHGLDTAARTS